MYGNPMNGNGWDVDGDGLCQMELFTEKMEK